MGVKHLPGAAVDLGRRGQAGLSAAAQVVHRDGAAVQRVQDVQRTVRFLRAEIAARLVAVAAVEVPQQARPALVHLPVDRAGRRQGSPVRVADERLELRPGVLVVLGLCLLDVPPQAGPGSVPGAQRGVEVAQRAEGVAEPASWLVVEVVLVVLGVAPQVRQLGGRHEPAQRVKGGDGVSSALFAVVAPRAARVGLGRVVLVVVPGLVPVAGRNPVVGAFLLPGYAELRAAVVLGRGDDRVGEVRLPERGQRDGLLLGRRLRVAPLEAEHAGVVAQVLPDGQRREPHDLEVRGAGQMALLQLPRVAALVAGVDQDPGPVHLLEKIAGHDVALEPDRVHAHVLHQRDLPGGVGRRVVQEEVRGESAAADDDRYAVDLEGPRPRLRCGGVVGYVGPDGQRGAGQARGATLQHVRVAVGQRPVDGELDGELDAGVVVRGDLVPVHVIDREHRVRVVRVDLDRERVRAPADQPGDGEAEPGVAAGDGAGGRHPVTVDPHAGRADHAVDDQRGVLARPQARGEAGPPPPGHGEPWHGVAADPVHVPVAPAHVVGEEHAVAALVALVHRLQCRVTWAAAVLRQRLDLGARRARAVVGDRQPGPGVEPRPGDLRPGLGGVRAAGHPPAVCAQVGDVAGPGRRARARREAQAGRRVRAGGGVQAGGADRRGTAWLRAVLPGLACAAGEGQASKVAARARQVPRASGGRMVRFTAGNSCLRPWAASGRPVEAQLVRILSKQTLSRPARSACSVPPAAPCSAAATRPISSLRLILTNARFLLFRSYAAAACQAARTARVCEGVGVAAEPLAIRAVMRVRRSLVSMSSKAGSVLAGYQGWAVRRAVMSAGSWPCRAYQVTTRVWVSRAKGTVRATAAGVRVRASPAPRMWRASKKACSMLHRAAYRWVKAVGAVIRSVVTRAKVAARLRAKITRTGRVLNEPYHRQVIWVSWVGWARP